MHHHHHHDNHRHHYDDNYHHFYDANNIVIGFVIGWFTVSLILLWKWVFKEQCVDWNGRIVWRWFRVPEMWVAITGGPANCWTPFVFFPTLTLLSHMVAATVTEYHTLVNWVLWILHIHIFCTLQSAYILHIAKCTVHISGVVCLLSNLDSTSAAK